MLLIFVSPLIFGSIRPTQLQQSMKLVLGAAAGSVACQIVLHFIHGLLRCLLHLPHHLIELSLSFQALVIR